MKASLVPVDCCRFLIFIPLMCTGFHTQTLRSFKISAGCNRRVHEFFSLALVACFPNKAELLDRHHMHACQNPYSLRPVTETRAVMLPDRTTSRH